MSLLRLIHLLSGLLFIASGCEFAEKGKVCPAGVGVQPVAYDGTGLSAKQLTLTFNGGPGEGTSAIDSVLFSNAIQATFFVTGKKIHGAESLLGTLKSHGHLIGNYTYSAISLNEAKDPEREVRRTDFMIYPYVSGNMYLLRSPGLANLSPDVAAELNKAGLSRYVGQIGWEIGDQSSGLVTDVDCWAIGKSPSDCAAGYLSAIKAIDHGIISLHADDSRTGELLQVLVPQLQSLKYSFVRLDTVPLIQTALKAASAQPGTVAGAPGCNDY